MNRAEQHSLFSERAALERMIADTPAADVIDLRSLQVRLEIINRALAQQTIETRLPVKARLTFRGRPVVGSHGIFAEFGMTATKGFTDAIALLAASLDTELAATGPIPNRDQNQLLITSTALGSFGFELEEHREQELPLEEESSVAQALRQAQALLRGAAAGSDDDLTDAASGQDPRALAAMRAFLRTLVDNEAVCAVAVGDQAFTFSDVGEVQRSLARLGENNLHEQPHPFSGVFQGALPKRRTFEFRVAATAEVISGKIGPGVPDPAALNHHLEQPTDIQLIETRVGEGRPRYVLNQLPNWT